jgi:large subunit ribosomal protein L29
MPNAAEVRELDIDELETKLAEFRRELLNLRFQLATGQLDNNSRLGHVRRDIARVLTELRARDVDEVEADLAAATRSVASSSTVPIKTITPMDEVDQEVADSEEVAADEIAVDEIAVDEIAVDEIAVDEIAVDEIAADDSEVVDVDEDASKDEESQ